MDGAARTPTRVFSTAINVGTVRLAEYRRVMLFNFTRRDKSKVGGLLVRRGRPLELTSRTKRWRCGTVPCIPSP